MRDSRPGTAPKQRVKVRARALSHREQQIVHNARELVQARSGSAQHRRAASTLARLQLDEHEKRLMERAARQHREHLDRMKGVQSARDELWQRPAVGAHQGRTSDLTNFLDTLGEQTIGLGMVKPSHAPGNILEAVGIHTRLPHDPPPRTGDLRHPVLGMVPWVPGRLGARGERTSVAADRSLTKFRRTKAGKQVTADLKQHPVRAEVHRQIDAHPELKPAEKRNLKNHFDNEVRAAAHQSGKTVDELLNEPGVRAEADRFHAVPRTPEEIVANATKNRVTGPVGGADPALRARVAQALQSHDVDTSVFRQADIDSHKFADLIARGEPGRMWYEHSAQTLLATAHGNRELADKLAQLVAVYSAQRAPVQNVQLAVNAFHEWQRTGKVASFGTGAQMEKANDILAGKPWKGLKTDRFYGNLLEEIDPAKYAAVFPGGEVTNDIWMARLFGLKTDNPTPREYHAMTGIVQKIASELGWKPKQVQAALWIAKKAEHEGTHIDEAAVDFSDALRVETAQIPFEAAPGAEFAPTLHGQYMKLSPERRREYTAAKAALVDDFLDELGIFGRLGHEGVGVYEGQINPGWSVYMPASRGKGAALKYSVSEHGRAELDAAAAAIGQAFHQDAAAWFKPFYRKSIPASQRNGVKAILGRGMTEEEAVALESAFSGAGHEIALVHDADGVHFLNLDSTTLANTDFHEVVDNAVAQTFSPETRMLAYAQDGNYITREQYAEHLGRDAGGRSDLYGAAALRLEERGATIDHAFLSEPGAGATGARIRFGGDGLSSGINPGFEDNTEKGLIGDWFAKLRHKDEPVPPDVPASEPAAEAALKGLKDVPAKQREQQALRSEELGRRAGLAEEAMAGVQGLEAKIIAAKTELQGALPKLEHNGIRSLSESEVDRVGELIGEHPDLMFFERLRAMDAFRNAYTAGVLPTKSELRLLRKALGPQVTTEMFSPSKMRNIRRGAFELMNMPRSLMASFDVSAPFRQGLVAFARHPMMTSKNLGPMMKYLGSEHGYQDLMRSIDARANRDLYAKAGLAITDVEHSLEQREEQFMSQLAEKLNIPVGGGHSVGPGHIVRASGRAYTGFLVKTRADMFDLLIEQAGRMGHDIEDPKLLRDLGNYINAATGRGSLGKLEGAAVALNSTFFSPRLMASRLTFLNPKSYVGLHPFVRRQKLRAAFQLAGAVGAVLWLGQQALGASVGGDPFSADFGKLRFGDTRVDITGGFAGYVRMLGTLGEAATGHDPDRKAQDAVVRFFRGKLAPTTGFGVDIVTHTDYTGYRDPDITKEVRDLFTPLIIQDTMKVINNDDSIAKVVGTAAASAVGFGVNTYKDRPKRGGSSKAEKAANFSAEYQKKFGRPLPAPIQQAQRTKDMYQAAEKRRKDELGVSSMTDEQRTYVKLSVLGSVRPDLRPAIRNFRGLLDQSANEEAQAFIDDWAEENLGWSMLDEFHSMLREAG